MLVYRVTTSPASYFIPTLLSQIWSCVVRSSFAGGHVGRLVRTVETEDATWWKLASLLSAMSESVCVCVCVCVCACVCVCSI